MSSDITFVFLSRHDNAYSLNPIAAAIESRFTSQEVETVFAKNLGAAERAIEEALGLRRQVIVAWFFCSIDRARSVRQLSCLKRHGSSSEVLHIAGGPHPSAEPEQMLDWIMSKSQLLFIQSFGYTYKIARIYISALRFPTFRMPLLEQQAVQKDVVAAVRLRNPLGPGSLTLLSFPKRDHSWRFGLCRARLSGSPCPKGSRSP